MEKMQSLFYRVALAASAVLSAVMFICANTASCSMIYQPETPKGLERFSKIR